MLDYHLPLTPVSDFDTPRKAHTQKKINKKSKQSKKDGPMSLDVRACEHVCLRAGEHIM